MGRCYASDESFGCIGRKRRREHARFARAVKVCGRWGGAGLEEERWGAGGERERALRGCESHPRAAMSDLMSFFTFHISTCVYQTKTEKMVIHVNRG